MTFQHDADGVPLEGTQSDRGDSDTELNGTEHSAIASTDNEVSDTEVSDNGNSDAEQSDTEYSAAAADSPQHGRALLALVAAGTVAVAPIASTVLGPAGGGDGAHSSPVFLLADISHDIGHNDWAFQGGLDDRFIWISTYVAIALAWLAVTLWMRARDRRASQDSGSRLWLKTLGVALAAEFAAGLLTIGAGLYAQWTATDIGPAMLRLADVCSPWWSCVAVLIVVARAERDTLALRAALAYGAVLALVLLVPFPGPSDVKALILAATAAIPALLDRRAVPGTAQPPVDSTSDAAQISPEQINAAQTSPIQTSPVQETSPAQQVSPVQLNSALIRQPRSDAAAAG